MGSRSDCLCWEIMQCENPDNCSARKNPQKLCWEIARDEGNDRHALNICMDCIVRLIKGGTPLLSNQEILEIMKSRAEHRLGDKNLSCPCTPPAG